LHAPHPGWPVVHSQAPPAQDSVDEQATRHPPQFALLVVRSTHVPLQQDWPAPQTLPQAPQLAVSPFVSTHALPHRVGVNPKHPMPQVPPLHTENPLPDVGPGHALPHAPQFLRSELSSTHAVLQRLGVGFVHVSPHTPAAHVAAPVPADGVGHALPHAPQLAGSALKWVQTAAGPLSTQQSVAPLEQTPSPWAWCAGTDGASTTINCTFAGLPGGMWHKVTGGALASAARSLDATPGASRSVLPAQAASIAGTYANAKEIVLLLGLIIVSFVRSRAYRRRTTASPYGADRQGNVQRQVSSPRPAL
jgi:hypothetical protein